MGARELPTRQTYRDYLRSPMWKSIRAQRLAVDNHTCQGCGTTKRLEVHHLTYDRLGKEPIHDLLTLCRRCHGEHHTMLQTPKRARTTKAKKPKRRFAKIMRIRRLRVSAQAIWQRQQNDTIQGTPDMRRTLLARLHT